MSPADYGQGITYWSRAFAGGRGGVMLSSYTRRRARFQSSTDHPPAFVSDAGCGHPQSGSPHRIFQTALEHLKGALLTVLRPGTKFCF